MDADQAAAPIRSTWPNATSSTPTRARLRTARASRSSATHGQNFNVWTALADGSGQVNLTTGIGGRNSFPDWGPTPSSLTASISIAGPESSDPGAASAPIDDIPLDAIRGQSQTTAARLGGIPLGGIPLGGIPVGGIPLGGIPWAGSAAGGEPEPEPPSGGVRCRRRPARAAGHVGGAPRRRAAALQGHSASERDARAGAWDAGRRRDHARQAQSRVEPTRRHSARRGCRWEAFRSAASRARRRIRTSPTGAGA